MSDVTGNCPTSITAKQNTAPQTLTQQTCPPLPIDANGKCPGIDARGGDLGLPPPPPQPTPLGDGSFQLPTVSPQPNTGTISSICPSGYHSTDVQCEINSQQKLPNGMCPDGTILTTDDRCVTPPVLSESTTGSGGEFIQMIPLKTTPPKQVEVPANPDGTCPAGSYSVGSSGNAGQPGTGSVICLANTPPLQP